MPALEGRTCSPGPFLSCRTSLSLLGHVGSLGGPGAILRSLSLLIHCLCAVVVATDKAGRPPLYRLYGRNSWLFSCKAISLLWHILAQDEPESDRHVLWPHDCNPISSSGGYQEPCWLSSQPLRTAWTSSGCTWWTDTFDIGPPRE